MNEELIELTRQDLEGLLLNAFHIGVQSVHEHAKSAAKNGLGEKVTKKMIEQILCGEVPTGEIQ